MVNGPLNGIRILDLSRLLPGPLATQMMADMGAEVIKIEDKKAPDYTRFMPPHFNGVGINYLALNRNKKSVVLDFSNESDKTQFFKLVQKADIVVDSFRPGVLKKLGIDYETAKQHNPAIIYVAVTGYGQTGSYSSKAGHDINYLGYSGVLSMMGDKDKVIKPGVQIADICGGSYPTVMACLAAVLHKKNTGEGQFVDVAMTDCVMPLLSFYMTEGLNTNHYYKRQEHPLAGSIVNYNIYKCKDEKWLALGSLEPKFWLNFCLMINKPEWNDKMMSNEIKDDITSLFISKERSEWLALSKQFDACLTPILELNELENEVYHKERNNFITVEDATKGTLKMINQPIKFSAFKNQSYTYPPEMGADNEEVLNNLK